MREIGSLEVHYHGRIVGRIAKTIDGKGAFQYDRQWLADGFSLDPFSLPLNDQVFVPKSDLLDGLFGVFADSLPDGWGRLLVDRLLLSKKISPGAVGAMERLGIVGSSGMGALGYVPELLQLDTQEQLDFDRLSIECESWKRCIGACALT